MDGAFQPQSELTPSVPPSPPAGQLCLLPTCRGNPPALCDVCLSAVSGDHWGLFSFLRPPGKQTSTPFQPTSGISLPAHMRMSPVVCHVHKWKPVSASVWERQKTPHFASKTTSFISCMSLQTENLYCYLHPLLLLSSSSVFLSTSICLTETPNPLLQVS